RSLSARCARNRPAGRHRRPAPRRRGTMSTLSRTRTDKRRTTVSAAISMREVVKSYGRVRALDGLDLEDARGEDLAHRGPNGAGKSTTIRSRLGILAHDAGTVRLLGEDPWSRAVSLHRRLAYVP